ncbi:SLAIN motif-containing protein 1-like [Tachysurus ichikawai]
MYVGDRPHPPSLRLGNDIVELVKNFVYLGSIVTDNGDIKPGCISSAVSLETTLAAPDYLTQDKAPDLQLCSTLHPAIWLGDLALKQDTGCKIRWV